MPLMQDFIGEYLTNNSPTVRCSYIQTWQNRKAVFCPSVAHEGIGTVEGDESDVVFYCSHHRRVVEAKRIVNKVEAKALKNWYDIFQPMANVNQ